MRDTVQVRIYNHKTVIESASPEALSLIKRKCKLQDGYWMNKEFKVTETINVFDKYDQSFPTGYLNILAEELDKNEIDIDGYDERVPVARTISITSKIKDINRRFNQTEIYKKVNEGANLGFITSPTASGKTQSIIDIIDINKVKTMIIVPTTGVRNMLAKELSSAFGNKHISTKVSSLGGSVADVRDAKGRQFKKREWDINGDEIEKPKTPEEEYLNDKGFDVYGSKAFRTRAIDKSKRKMTKEEKDSTPKLPNVLIICIGAINFLPTEVLEHYEMLLVDEGHFGKCETIRQLSLLMPNAYYKYAMSATNGLENPVKMKLLCSVFGTTIIYETSALDCIQEGIILDVKMIDRETSCNMWLKDNKDKYVRGTDNIVKLGIVGNSNRNSQIAEDCYDYFHIDGARMLVEINEEYHGHILKAKMEEKGLKPYFYYADLPRKEKEEILNMMEHSKEPYIVIATSAARQGINTITLNHLYLADAKKSMTDLIQWIGRLQRVDGLVSQVKVINPIDHFHPKLFEWSRKRKKDFEDYYVKGIKMTQEMLERHKIGHKILE